MTKHFKKITRIIIGVSLIKKCVWLFLILLIVSCNSLKVELYRCDLSDCSNIIHNHEELKRYENIRSSVTGLYGNFDIDFIEDSVVLPMEVRNNIPLVKIKINNKFFL